MQKIYSQVLTIKNALRNHKHHTHLNTYFWAMPLEKTPKGKPVNERILLASEEENNYSR
jgi:hypothetical protein